MSTGVSIMTKQLVVGHAGAATGGMERRLTDPARPQLLRLRSRFSFFSSMVVCVVPRRHSGRTGCTPNPLATALLVGVARPTRHPPPPQSPTWDPSPLNPRFELPLFFCDKACEKLFFLFSLLVPVGGYISFAQCTALARGSASPQVRVRGYKNVLRKRGSGDDSTVMPASQLTCLP